MDSAIKGLKMAIKSADIGELAGVIAQDIGIPSREDPDSLSDWMDDVADLAFLGNRDAIVQLIFVGRRAAETLKSLAIPIPPRQGEQTEQRSVGTIRSGTGAEQPEKWREMLNKSAGALFEIMEDASPAELEEVRQSLAELPNARFNFPLDFLVGHSEPPGEAMQIVSDLCDRFIERRLRKWRAQLVQEEACMAQEWPLVVSALDLRRDSKISDLAPGLNIGSSTPFGLLPAGSRDDGPSRIALSLFMILDKERRTPKAQSHLDELRKAEEENIPNLDSLIRGAPSRSRRLSPKITPPIPGQREEWTIRNIWRRKAALLPALAPDSHDRWMEAAYALAAAECAGDFENHHWPKCISDRVEGVGSVRAALRRVLKEGFELLAREFINPTPS